MISHIPSHESIAEAAICKKKKYMIWVFFFFSETCSSVENIQFEKYSVSPSTKNLGSVPRFPSSSAQTRCYLVENVKFSSAFQVMVSLRCCLSEFLKKLFHFHKGKGVYSTSRMKSLVPIPIIRLPPFITCSNIFICPDTMWESTPVFAGVFWWAVIVLAWFSKINRQDFK